ncbi:N-acetylmuramoyl-L-alanine amidase [Oceanicola sp. 22II-s10i]|nr:N-acetylmuramoyl-L-alanine amidase [Oceanicola sp. 22II-s10i]
MTAGAVAGQGRDFTALARVDVTESAIEDMRGGLSVDLNLSQGVPWRVFTLDDPARAVFDFREVDWTGVDNAALFEPGAATAVRFGTVRPGWSRLVIDLGGPLALDRAGMQVDEVTGRARLTARFIAATPSDFAAASGAPADDPVWDTAGSERPKGIGDGPLVVVIDPGHGGIDPGAEREGIVEKDLMLTLARELSETLIRAGGIDVILTRADDSFVSLERRVEIAHEVGAHVFISLHADALAEGRARGAVVHTLSDTASDEASALLAERHDRDDLLSGVDLTGKDDQIADVLLDLARQETTPRTARLAQALVTGLNAAGVPRNSKPIRSAGFSVLKAADIPSVLIEVGFLSDRRDRGNLTNPDFRGHFAGAVRDALLAWMKEDAALAPLIRR